MDAERSLLELLEGIHDPRVPRASGTPFPLFSRWLSSPCLRA